MPTPPSTPKTWLAGATLSADDLNTHVRDTTSFLLNRPIVAADCTGLVNGTHNVIPTATWTDITLNTELADSDGFWDAGVPKRFTVPVGFPDSWYRVNAEWVSASYSGAAGNYAGLRVLKNATAVLVGRYTPPTTASPTEINISGLVRLSAGDYVLMQAWQNTGSDKNTNNSTLSFMQLIWERFA